MQFLELYEIVKAFVLCVERLPENINFLSIQYFTDLKVGLHHNKNMDYLKSFSISTILVILGLSKSNPS